MKLSKRLHILEHAANANMQRPKIILFSTIRSTDDGRLITSEPASATILGAPNIVLRREDEGLDEFDTRLEEMADALFLKWQVPMGA